MPSPNQSATVVLDNGGGSLKAGVHKPNTNPSKPTPSKTLTVPNALAKPSASAIAPPQSLPGKSRRPPGHLIAAEIEKAPDVSGMLFRRPHDRGILSTFDLQRDIWTSALSSDRGLDLSSIPSPHSLLLTEPLGVPIRVRRATDQLVFEACSFDACAISPPQRLAAATFGQPLGSMCRPTCLVLDSGFSATTAVPIVNGRELPAAVRRLSLGGKALTNLLKQTISFRSWNMSEETAVINAVKHRCCYVASDYCPALDTIHKSPALSYVLPDPARCSDPFGHIRLPGEKHDASDQVLQMRNERIAIPEALFNPSDIGLEQAGVAELVLQSVHACDPHVHPDLFSNILLTGGNCLFPGFRDRFVNELRPLVGSDIDIRVLLDHDPIHTTIHGAMNALDGQLVPLSFITREKYNEVGSDGLLREIYNH